MQLLWWYIFWALLKGCIAMATKVERTVVVPVSMYGQLLKLAESEHSNVPFVTRQLLAKALAELKSRPNWFYEIQDQILELREDVVGAQKLKEQQELSGEQLLLELKKQIAELTEAVSAVPEKTKAKMEEEKPGQVVLFSEAETEPEEEVISIEQPKEKVARPFFGRLTAMFGSILS